MSIIISILGFSFLVFIHELGHFIFARMTGMKVDKFSIGFGPALYQFGKDTVYQIALLPFGGFVQIKGLNPEPGQDFERSTEHSSQDKQLQQLIDEWGTEDNQVFSPVEEFDSAMQQVQQKEVEIEEAAETEEERLQREAEELEGSFLSKPLWARFLVVSGGPLFNALFTFFVFAAMFIGQSAFSAKGMRRTSLVIKEVSGAAAKEGILSGDVLISINDQPVYDFSQIRYKTVSSKGQALSIVIARPPTPDTRAYKAINAYDECATKNKEIEELKLEEGQSFVKDCEQFKGIHIYSGIAQDDWERKTFTVTPENLTPQSESAQYRIGIAPELERFGSDSIGQSLVLAWNEVGHLISEMSTKIYRGIKGEEKVEVASVVKITAISADTIKMGSEWFLNFLAFLSLNLAFLNLLPFPALDGGRLIFLAIEAISRRPVPPKFEMVVHGIGILMLLILTLWVTTKDILSLL